MDITDLPEEPEQLRNVKRVVKELNKPMKAIEQLQRQSRQFELMQRQLAPLRQLEEIQRHLAPLRQYEEIQRQLAPLRQWEEVQRQLASVRQVEEVQQQLAPFRQWEKIQKLADLHAQRMILQHLPTIQSGLQENILRDALGASSINAAATLLNSKLERVDRHYEWFDRLQRKATGGLLISELAQHIELVNPTLTSLAEAQSVIDGIRASLKSGAHRPAEIIDEDAQAAKEAAAVIEEAATAEPTLSATAFQIAKQIQAQPNESVQLILWAYFNKLFDSIVNGTIAAVMYVVVTQQMQPAPAQSPPQAVKAVKEAVRTTVGSAELLSEHRFVSAKTLNVRLNPKARSPKIAELPFGAAVRLLKKDSDFALVVWADAESGAEIQGWVFARYLQKFN